MQQRVHMLEEQLRESELRHEERLQDEVRRARELVGRVERDKSSQLEQCSARARAMEQELLELREEAARQRGRAERLQAEREEMAQHLKDVRGELDRARNIEMTCREQERR